MIFMRRYYWWSEEFNLLYISSLIFRNDIRGDFFRKWLRWKILRWVMMLYLHYLWVEKKIDMNSNEEIGNRLEIEIEMIEEEFEMEIYQDIWIIQV